MNKKESRRGRDRKVKTRDIPGNAGLEIRVFCMEVAGGGWFVVAEERGERIRRRGERVRRGAEEVGCWIGREMKGFGWETGGTGRDWFRS